MWGFSLGALTATSLALRHAEQDDLRLPTEAEFFTWQVDDEPVSPNPPDFFPFVERLQPVVHDFAGWSDGQIRSISAPTLLLIGDRDFVRVDHAAVMLDLLPDARLAVLPATRHTEVMQRTDEFRALVRPFLTSRHKASQTPSWLVVAERRN